ncbi:MAG: hypothetical protein GX879_02890 [Bacteroidales bacterium]|nr:hypothetical protein [Bacteroidales bacterium]
MEDLNLNKKNNFKTPDSYFEKLPEQVSKKIKEKKDLNKIKVFDIVKPYIYLAAGFVAIGLFARFAIHFFVNDDVLKTKPEIEQIANVDYYYFDDLIDDDYIFYETLESYSEDYYTFTDDISTEAIENYLIDYDIFLDLID